MKQLSAESAALEARKASFALEFQKCRPALTAVGDSTRQAILLNLIKNGGKGGLRVGEIQKETSISRAAVSHHLKILKEAHIIAMRQDGTKNYYFLDPQSSSLRQLVRFWELVEPMMALCEQSQKSEGRLVK